MTTAITGRLATCPNCDRAAGIPLPCRSTIIKDADEAVSPIRRYGGAWHAVDTDGTCRCGGDEFTLIESG